MSAPPGLHVIRTQAFQITTERESGARSLLHLAGVLWEQRMAGETDDVFSAVCPPRRAVRLERIELDLGRIPAAAFEAEFPARFRAALEKELRQRLPSFPESSLAGDDPATAAGRDALEMLEHLLLHGTLPWWASPDSDYDPALLLAAALQERPGAVSELARGIGGQERVRYRLVHWLDDPEMADLIRAVAPGDAPFILRYAEDLDARQQEEPIVSATRDDFRHAKWEVILSHLLTAHGSWFNAKAFLRGTLRGLAARFRLDYLELLRELARVASEAKVDWRERTLPQLLVEIHAEDTRHERQKNATPVDTRDRAHEPDTSEEPAGWDEIVGKLLTAWNAELGSPAGMRSEAARAALAFWRVLPAYVLPQFVLRLAKTHAVPALARRIAETFGFAERAVLHEQLVLGCKRAEAATVARLEAVLQQPGKLTGLASADEPGDELEAAEFTPSEEARIFAALRTVLETGRLPAAERVGETASEEAWLLATLTIHADAIPRLLRAWAKPGRLTAAMTAHLSTPALEAVVETVVPAHAREVTTFVRTAIAAQEKGMSDIPEGGDFRRDTWRVVLDYLLSESGSVFNRRSFLEYSIRALAARHALTVDAVMTFVGEAAQQEGRHELLQDLRMLFAARDPIAQDVQLAAVLGVEMPRVPETTSELPSENTLRHSAVARLHVLRRALIGEEVAAALLPRLWAIDASELTAQARAEMVRRGATARGVAAMLASAGDAWLSQPIFAGERATAQVWGDCVEWLVESRAAAALFPGGRTALRARLWAALLALWREDGGRPIRNIAALLGVLLLRAGVRTDWLPANATTAQREHAARQLFEAACARDGSATAKGLAAHVRRAAPFRASVVPPWRQPPAPIRQDEITAADSPSMNEPIAVRNAGLVLLAPYFPELHRRCGLVEGSVFRDYVANQRAVHLLQYVATGGSRTHEYSLVLNKILCGLNPEVPVVPHVELTEAETAAVQQLLEHVAAQWPRGAKISPDGLRGSYLVRPGVLKRRERGWALAVERRGWDILLPELPWSFPGVRPAWMPEPLEVDWI